ncbi:CCC motif membrane protein [Pedobacter lithocola]
MSEEQGIPEENRPINPVNNETPPFGPPITPPVTPPPFQQQPPFGQFGGGMGYQNLPNSTIVLVLGILSIAFCCCYGILGLIPAIIALVLSKKDKALYNANPSIYSLSSYKNLNAGRICAIIGLILNILSLAYYAVIIIMFGTGMMSDPQKMQEILKGLQ